LQWIRRVIIRGNCGFGRNALEKLVLNLGNKDSKQTKYPSNFGTLRIPRILDLGNADITIVQFRPYDIPVTALYPYYL